VYTKKADGSSSSDHGVCLFMPLLQTAMPQQLARIRDVVLRNDPTGMLRNRWLSQVFDLPYNE
jgi:hypothetical protein